MRKVVKTFNNDANPVNIYYNIANNEIRWFFSHIPVDEYRRVIGEDSPFIDENEKALGLLLNIYEVISENLTFLISRKISLIIRIWNQTK